MRLAKYLAHAGVASRRASETIIADGRVTVDGAVITDPARDVDDSRAVKVDGRRVQASPATKQIVYLLHKPAARRLDGEGPAGPHDRRLARAHAASACTRSAGWTTTRPA